jgi:hypothetical protein
MTEATKPEQTLADYVASAISPALIMTLIGSLVFFLVEVAYLGAYYGRLQWFVFFFVFGAVLVARIAVLGDIASRANLYNAVLGLLMWIALMTYVQFPAGTPAADWGWAIHLGFIVLIVWCANRLTRDCTLEGGVADASGAGLLDAAGLDRAKADKAAGDTPKKSKRRKREPGGLTGWWQRYQRYRAEKRQRPRTHGVWVVYFSLAALPLFGLGQALIPAEHTGRRQYAFWLMCIYVASGLGLLLSTTFLSLRRYLSQRKLRMPAAVTTSWLFFGAALIVGLLVVGALVPRPHPEYSLVEHFSPFGSPERKASDWAMKGDEPAEGEGAPADSAPKEGQDPSGTQGQGKKPDGQKGSKSGNGDGQGQQHGNAQSNSQGSKSGDNSGNKPGQKRDGSKGQPQGDSKGERGDGKETSTGSPSSADKPKSPFNLTLPDWLKPLSEILKWVVLAIVIVMVVFLLLRALLGFLANFTGWARNLLNWFRSWWENLHLRKPAAAEDAEAKSAQPVGRPFSWYRDPFQSGDADRLPDRELIRYSFEALQAWARERSLTRPEGETPLEFARRLGDEFPALEADALRLADLYATAAYAPALLGTDNAEDLRSFWLTLREVTERPLSAGTLSTP